MFDGTGGDESECYSALLSGDDWNDWLVERLPDRPTNLLLVNRIEILPGYRRRGLGLLMLQKLVSSAFVSYGTIITLKPYAVGYDLKKEKVAQALGTRKLSAYWRRAGFKKIRGQGYYYLSVF
jgi:hypothetical protein